MEKSSYGIQEIKAEKDKALACQMIMDSLDVIMNQENSEETSAEVNPSLLLEYLIEALMAANGCSHLLPEDKNLYLMLLKKAVNLVPIEMILNEKIMPYRKKNLVDLKANVIFEEDMIDIHKDKLVYLMISEFESDNLILEGYHYLELFQNKSLCIVDNDNKVYFPKITSWPLRDCIGIDGEKICDARRFRFEIPCWKNKKFEICIQDKDGYQSIKLRFGAHSRLDSKNSWSYFQNGEYIVSFKKGIFSINEYSRKRHIIHELRAFKNLTKKKEYKVVMQRALYYLCCFVSKKPVWLFRDNEDRAKDSAIEMYKYYSSWEERNKYDAYFIIDKKSEDYQLVRKYGKTLQPYSLKYKMKFLQADIVIDTRGSLNPRYVFGDKAAYFKDLCHWKYIWLIHGVMTRNESTWTNKFAINAKIYATCGVRECNAVKSEMNGYGYDHGEVVITGLPRHDGLFRDNEEKRIVFMPTWRKDYAGDPIPGTSDRLYVDNFKENDFFKFYNALINDERLLSCMKKYGYTGSFCLHPSFIKQSGDFEGNDIISVEDKPVNANKMIGESSLLITDYSSAAFEAAYLNIPVVYTQYDIDTFGERHTGKDGYFDYFEDGFGKVCTTYEDSVETIISHIANGCENEKKYSDRADEFFVYRDKENCRRVFEAMGKIIHPNTQENQNRPALLDKVEKLGYRIDDQGNELKIYDSNNVLVSLYLEKEYHKVCNKPFEIEICSQSVKRTAEGFKIAGKIYSKNFRGFEECSPSVKIGESKFPVDLGPEKKKHGWIESRFSADIRVADINFEKKTTEIYFVMTDIAGYGYQNRIKFMHLNNATLWRRVKRKKLFYSKVYNDDLGNSYYIYQNRNNRMSIVCRDSNVTDSTTERIKINVAYMLSKIVVFGRLKECNLCFEKFAGKYEESASVVYEKFIDEGDKKTFFVINKESDDLKKIKPEYRKNVIFKYSFKHYLAFFLAKSFISTESMNHVIELNICNPHVTYRIDSDKYKYYFLQHGVMYMYALKGRGGFRRGAGGFGDNAKIVVSSELEAQHFIEEGNFKRENLVICGLPKFDRATRNDIHERITIMPTSRDFEYNVIRQHPEESTYYQFLISIIREIPESYLDKVIIIPHPLIKDCFANTELSTFIPSKWKYDEILKETDLLITDYSSISYDAFYRGCNVIFCWEHKDMCLKRLGYGLKLNESNAFADISCDFSDIGDLVVNNYGKPQRKENIEKYRKIVEFNDNHNTERCYRFIVSDMASSMKKEGIKKRILNIVGRHVLLMTILDYTLTLKHNVKPPKRKPFSECAIMQDNRDGNSALSGYAVYFDGVRLKKDKDFEISSEEKINDAISKIILKGCGKYTGKKGFYIEK